MSNITSSDVASMILRTHYKYEAKDGFGIMTIKGIKLPKTSFDVFGCLWATVKKRVKEAFGVMSAGSFVYNDGMVSCGFYLSFADCEDNKEVIADQIKLFDETFEQQMTLFKSALELWLTDEEWGYIPYADYLNTTEEPDHQILKNMVDVFLTKSGLETEDDRKAKAKRNKRLKGAKSSQA